jgi:hypothetical protein
LEDLGIGGRIIKLEIRLGSAFNFEERGIR